MKHINQSIIFAFLVSMFVACAPQAAVVESTPAQIQLTNTASPPTAALTSTSIPTETSGPTLIPSATAASCAVPLNPSDNATVPARGPFDFTWTSFTGAASYVISIGPEDWYPTNFPVTGTTLTRYMETFQSSPSYEWSITALDSSGKEICKTEPVTFVTSAGEYATPSVAGGVVLQPTSATIASGVNPPLETINNDFGVNLVSVEAGACSVGATFSVNTANSVDFSVLRYTLDPAEANSIDFCNWGYGVNLWSYSPGIYQGGLDLSNFPSLHNGGTIYLMAKFVFNGGVVACSQLIQQTITTECSGNE